jgi:uncharacterized protein involved in exopolysaccharide biosynthesis
LAPASLSRQGYWEGESSEISVLTLLNVVLRNRHLVVGLSALGIVIGVVAAVFVGREYGAESRFMPVQAQHDEPRLGQLAAQLGMGGIVGPTTSVDFYAELLKSRDLLGAVVTSEYEFVVDEATGETRSGTLVELLPVKGETPEARLQSAVGRLGERVSVSIHSRSGLITLTTMAPWRNLAVQVNERLLEYLDDFNRERRQTAVGAERSFIEDRVAEAQVELTEAERALERFLDENRGFLTSPRLAFESARLERQVDIRHRRYMDLAQAYEQARIEEVRNTPAITVVDLPKPSGRTGRRIQALLVLLGLALGTSLAVVISFTREYLAWLRSSRPGEYAEFKDLRRTAAKELAPGWVLARLRSTEGRLPAQGASETEGTKAPGGEGGGERE